MSDCDSDIERGSGGTKTVYHGRIKIYGGRQRRIANLIFQARLPKTKVAASHPGLLELLSCSTQLLAILFGAQSWVTMVLIPESSYFPPLDKCLTGEQPLM